MMHRLIKFFSFFGLMIVTAIGMALDSVVISRIQFQGLSNIPQSSVRHYLPFHEGETLTPERSGQIVQSLYKTGFFDNVQLFQQQDTLVIRVDERPVITMIKVYGNKAIKNKDLDPVMKKLGVEEGAVYDPQKLSLLCIGLEQQYGLLGYRATKVTTTVTPMSNHRVEVTIHVNEGPIAKVRSIEFVGNHAFTARQLRNQMQLTSSWITTIMSHKNRFSQEKLDMDLNSISNFYFNHGYLQFRIVESKATLTPDHKGVNIIIAVSEGPQYRVSNADILPHNLLGREEMLKKLTVRKGSIFSREDVQASTKIIQDYLGERGYALAKVDSQPTLDQVNHLARIEFTVELGPRVYVHRIQFFGNQRTKETVLRREMRQMEGGLYSLKDINESKRRIALLPYLQNVQIQTVPVQGTNDQVDLNVQSKEVAAGRASVQAGYSDSVGFLYGASISEPNFLGSGDAVSLGFENSQVQQYYHFTWARPYITVNGISQSFNIYYSRAEYDPEFNYQSYTTDGFGTDLTYGFPITENNRFSFGLGYSNVAINHVNEQRIAPSVTTFLTDYPSPYNLMKATTGWSYNGLDRFIYPTSGWYDSLGFELGVPIFDTSLGYYKLTDSLHWYVPTWWGFVLDMEGHGGYGQGFGNESRLPFFLNFYGGGLSGGLPAYSPNSLGPKNLADGDAALGGSLILTGGVHLLSPTFFSDKVRVGLALDAGNVFQDPLFSEDMNSPNIIQDETFNLSNMRTSLGVIFYWYSPMGPLNLSLAYPLNEKEGDRLEAFQFSFGTSL